MFLVTPLFVVVSRVGPIIDVSYIPSLPKRQIASKAASDAMRDQLRRVATYQRYVLVALLVNIVFVTFDVACGMGLISIPSNYLPAIRVAHFPVCIFMTACAVLLAKQFWHIGIAILCGVMMWIPVASLVALLVVNQKATRFLQQWDVKVGLLGANPGRI